MHVEIFDNNHPCSPRLVHDLDNLPEAIFYADRDEIDERTCISGPTICRVEILDNNNKIGRFWVSAQIKNGRPVLVVTAQLSNGKEKSSMTTGQFVL